MKTLVALPILVAVAAVMAGKHSVKFSFNVKEKQAHFKQDVEADVYNNHAYFKTPAHNGITETHKIQDFNKGIQLSCMPLVRECYVSDIDRSIYPHPGKLIIDAQSSSTNLTEETASLKTFHWIKSSRLSSTDGFSKEMVQFYKRYNYPLFTLDIIKNTSLILGGSLSKRMYTPFAKIRAQTVNPMYQLSGQNSMLGPIEPVNPEIIFRHTTESPFRPWIKHSQGKDFYLQPQKNITTTTPTPSTTEYHPPCYPKAPLVRYGYTGTSGCDYLTFCDGFSKREIHTRQEIDQHHYRMNSTVNFGKNCKTKHIVNTIFYKCLCCPEDKRVSDCLYCSNLSDHMSNYGLHNN